jgi:hypothetical protein
MVAIIFAICTSTFTMTTLAGGQPNDNWSPDSSETIKPTKPDPENGRIIARALCTNCHVIVRPNAAAPAFQRLPTNWINQPNVYRLGCLALTGRCQTFI